jgi:hypothetical protein
MRLGAFLMPDKSLLKKGNSLQKCDALRLIAQKSGLARLMSFAALNWSAIINSTSSLSFSQFVCVYAVPLCADSFNYTRAGESGDGLQVYTLCWR